MRPSPRIRSLLPAQPGWFVIRAMSGGESKLGHYHSDPIVCWALLHASETIVALTIYPYQRGSEPIAQLEVLEDMPDFVGYNYPGCSVNWREATQEFHRNYWDATHECWIAELTTLDE
jgi:hypothetical protein